METIKITKMQGCGNDFVIADYDEFKKADMEISEFAKKVCDRHFGVGADGFITIKPGETSEADIEWLFYNSDGSIAQMCGNGMRCFAKYVYDKKLVNAKSFRVKTLAGIIKPEILDNGLVKVNMGTPILEDEKIPFKGERKITVAGKEFEIFPVSMGNPHCVIFTNENPYEMAKNFGPEIEKHPYFPEKTNVEFVKVISRNEVDMCVYERGCGITLACGTGACATTIACILNNLTDCNVKVNLPGGALSIDWQGSPVDTDKDVYLLGEANYSFYADYML